MCPSFLHVHSVFFHATDLPSHKGAMVSASCLKAGYGNKEIQKEKCKSSFWKLSYFISLGRGRDGQSLHLRMLVCHDLHGLQSAWSELDLVLMGKGSSKVTGRF